MNKDLIDRLNAEAESCAEEGLDDIAALLDEARAAIEAQSVTHSGHAVVAGALFDFMGFLTSQKERYVFSASDDASPAVEAIQAFSAKRGLTLADAKVREWIDCLAAPQPAQQAQSVPAGCDIHSPFNACMHREYCRSLAAAPQPAQEPVARIGHAKFDGGRPDAKGWETNTIEWLGDAPNNLRVGTLLICATPQAQPEQEPVKGWWAHTHPEGGSVYVVKYQLTPTDKLAGWVEHEIYTTPQAQPVQEPVGWIDAKGLEELGNPELNWMPIWNRQSGSRPIALYTTPQAQPARPSDLSSVYRTELDKLSMRNYELRMENAQLKARPVLEPVKGWWVHTCPEDGKVDVVNYQLTLADKAAGWVEHEIYTTPQAQPLTTPEKLTIAAQAMEQAIGGQAACLAAVELTVERITKGTT